MSEWLVGGLLTYAVVAIGCAHSEGELRVRHDSPEPPIHSVLMALLWPLSIAYMRASNRALDKKLNGGKQ